MRLRRCLPDRGRGKPVESGCWRVMCFLSGVTAVAFCVVVAGCAPRAEVPSTPPTQAYPASFTGTVPCSDQADAMCATLPVPLDYQSPSGGSLKLAVRWSTTAAQGSPILVSLDGGPGLGDNRSMLESTVKALPEVAKSHRIAVIETRGTGASALDCPVLQRQGDAAAAHVMPVPPEIVSGCGETLGEARQFYSTEDTVADLDVFRRALGVSTWSMMGVSYGTFQTQRYAITHPDNVTKLVLDSVVPQNGGDPSYAPALSESGRVMSEVCASYRCGFDPSADLVKILSEGEDGVPIFNALIEAGSFDTDFEPVIEAIHEAAQGNPEPLHRVTAVPDRGLPSAAEFSTALQLATLCTDMRYPWGNSETPVADRHPAAVAAIGALPPAQLLPFDSRTALEQGAISNCEPWPVTPAASYSGELPSKPALLINGGWDLLTPAIDARQQAQRMPRSQLVIVPEWGHVAIASPKGSRAISSFLLS